MSDLRLSITKVANGYTVQQVVPSDKGDFVSDDHLYIAPTQKEVAEVVKAICRGAFDEIKVKLTSGVSNEALGIKKQDAGRQGGSRPSKKAKTDE